MRLCFSSFSMVLLANKKNSAATKIAVGKELLDLIDPGYSLGKDERYIYYFMDDERELPKDLKSQKWNMPNLSDQFLRFTDTYLSPDHERMRHDLVSLIQEDAGMPDAPKEHLLKLSEEAELPTFLAEVFVFAVGSAASKNDGAKPRMSRKHFNLTREIRETLDNEILCDLAQAAIGEQDVESLAACFAKMTNHVYIARARVFLSQDQNFAGHPDYMGMFHATFSGMENNKYRHKVFEGCLKAGYFSICPERLLDLHLSEYTNNRYTYETLMLLCEIGLRKQAEQYRYLLTNKTYGKRLELHLSEYPQTKNAPQGAHCVIK